MRDVEAALARIAATDRLLVASDFDGTLSPIARRPDAVRVDAPACDALRSLGGLPKTAAAVISGRSRSRLRELLGEYAVDVRLVGSHGAEPDDARALGEEARRAREELARVLECIASRYPGALVEPKPFGIALHYRGVARPDAEAVAREAREAVREAGARVQRGHEVVEGVLAGIDKGDALVTLREETDSSAVFYVGDDATDEAAFERLGRGDIGIKVGDGPTLAALRVEGQVDVAPLLARLLDLRARHA